MRALIVAAILLAGCGALLDDSDEVEAPTRTGVDAGAPCRFDEFSTSKFDDCAFAP